LLSRGVKKRGPELSGIVSAKVQFIEHRSRSFKAKTVTFRLPSFSRRGRGGWMMTATYSNFFRQDEQDEQDAQDKKGLLPTARAVDSLPAESGMRAGKIIQ